MLATALPCDDELAQPRCQRLDRAFRVCEREARVSDALSVSQRTRAGFLSPAHQMTFDHKGLQSHLTGQSLCE